MGDFTAVVGVKSMEPCVISDPWAKAGLMAREELSSGSRHTMICRSLKNGASVQYRDYTDGGSGYAPLQGEYGLDDIVWLRLDRRGDAFIGSYAVGGTTVPTEWKAAGYHVSPMPENVHVGFATTSHQQGTPITVEYFGLGLRTEDPLYVLPPELPAIGGTGAGYMLIREVVDNGELPGQGACFKSLASGAGTIVDYTAGMLNIYDSDAGGHYWNDAAFGVVTAGVKTRGSVDDLSMLVRGMIRIPEGQGGLWTFVVNSDDGFTLQFPGHDFQSMSGGGWIVPFTNGAGLQFYEGRGAADTSGVIELPAGYHPFWLTYHEGWQGAEVEFFAAHGEYVDFDQQVFRPVGYTSSGAVNVPGLADAVKVTQTEPYLSSGQINSLHEAEYEFAINAGSTLTELYPAVNLSDPDNPGNGGIFGSQYKESFPYDYSMMGVDDDDFAVRASGTLDIPADGTYQIGFNSDDGASLRIAGQEWKSIVADWTGQAVIADDQLINDTMGASSFTVGEIDLEAGSYSFELLMFERSGGSYVELFAMTELRPVLLVVEGSASYPELQGLQLVCFPSVAVPGDLNLDCRVGLADFAIIAANWLVDCTIDWDHPECLQP